MNISHKKYTLRFVNPATTSRGALQTKDSWFIRIHDPLRNKTGIGEVSIIPGLSPDEPEEIEEALIDLQKRPHELCSEYKIRYGHLPAFCFGLETALRDLGMSGTRILYQNEFTSGRQPITINGLIWMAPKEDMYRQVKEKIETGFKCIKLKIGAIEFSDELELLAHIRKNFSASEVEIRVDANGAFDSSEALDRLKLLSDYSLHSIEQPIKPRQWEALAKLVESTPLPIVLDEELIGIYDPEEKQRLLDTVRPHYLVFKPSLIGGIDAAEQWINLIEDTEIQWWVTSALESNVGLNAIAQWVADYSPELPQGLGTGQLYENNIKSPLVLNGQNLHYVASRNWDIQALEE